MTLDEQRALVGVYAAGEQNRRKLARLSSQVVRVDLYRDGVEVNDAEEVLLGVLVLHPLLERADVVTELRVSAWLNPAEHTLSSNGVSHAFRFFSYLSSHVGILQLSIYNDKFTIISSQRLPNRADNPA